MKRKLLKMLMQGLAPAGIILIVLSVSGWDPISKWIVLFSFGWICLNFLGEFIWPNKYEI